MDNYHIDQADWIGTSMGGLIGMRIASGSLAHRLSSLIINDIGPQIPQDAIDRNLAYAGDLPVFDKVSEAEAWLKNIYAPFGPASTAFWRCMARSSVRRRDDGSITIPLRPQNHYAVMTALSMWYLPCNWLTHETIF